MRNYQSLILKQITKVESLMNDPSELTPRQSRIVRRQPQTIIKQISTPFLAGKNQIRPTSSYNIQVPFIYQNQISSVNSQKTASFNQIYQKQYIKAQNLGPQTAIFDRNFSYGQNYKNWNQAYLNAPQVHRRSEYIPYYQTYIDYVQKKVKAPVGKTYIDYYQIQHVTEYVPIQKEDIIMQTIPVQTVKMRLEYVPVQQKIIHVSNKDAKTIAIDNTFTVKNQNYRNWAFQRPNANGKYVTTQRYDSQANIKEIDDMINWSVQASRFEKKQTTD